jgi:enoyl-CoA hydratase/carnithine racemase
VLITGQPGMFTSGNDLEDFMQRPPQGMDSPVFQFMQALLDCDKPVVAAVTGVAVGIGTTMLLHCDFVYVSDEARLAMPFVSLGLVPEYASSLVLPQLMGHVRAAEKLMLGEPFTGADAVDCGIANAVLPAGEVVGHARRMAERFNALPPGAVRDAKRLMRAPLKDQLQQVMRTEAEIFGARLRSPEAMEAFQAFFQKRKPDFSKF